MGGDDIDFERGTMYIHSNRVAASGGVVVKAPKSKSGVRTIALGDHLLTMMKWEYRRYLDDKASIPGFVDSGCLVRQENGKPYNPDAWGKKWKRFQTSTGLKMNRLHDLRHYNTTALINAGIDLKTIQSRLGHADISMTLDVYAHTTKQAQKDAAEKIDNLVFTSQQNPQQKEA